MCDAPRAFAPGFKAHLQRQKPHDFAEPARCPCDLKDDEVPATTLINAYKSACTLSTKQIAIKFNHLRAERSPIAQFFAYGFPKKLPYWSMWLGREGTGFPPTSVTQDM